MRGGKAADTHTPHAHAQPRCTHSTHAHTPARMQACHPGVSCVPSLAAQAAAPRTSRQHVRRQRDSQPGTSGHLQRRRPCELAPPRDQPSQHAFRTSASFLDEGPQHALQPANPDPQLANAGKEVANRVTRWLGFVSLPPARAATLVRPPRPTSPPDLLPVPADKRTFRAVDFAALWVTLVISVSSYYLAASLVDLGMCWWQVRVPVAVVAGWL